MRRRRRRLVPALAWLCCGATWVPSDARIGFVQDRTLTVVSGTALLATATLCPGFAFDPLGVGGPRLSPSLHFVLVDVLGPFAPGDVRRTSAIVDVATGAVVLAPDFPQYFGVPSSALPLQWVSGERAVLRYDDGKTAAVREPPLKPLPPPGCSR
jgi:hypothetical protein